MTTAVAPIADKKSPAIIQLLDAAGTRLAPLLPKGVDLERVKSEVFFAARHNPDILACTPDSIVRAVAKAIQRDLIIGETVYLVPTNERYKDEADQWQSRKVLNVWNDWKGDVTMVLRSGAAQAVTPKAVFANEKFEYWEDLEPHLLHHPTVDATKRGEIIGAYCRARIKFGHYQVLWMPIADIEAIRAKSRSWAPNLATKKNLVCPPWYAKKTVVHALCNELPKNAKLAELSREIASELGLDPADEIRPRVPSATATPTSDEFPQGVDLETGEVLE